MATNEAIDLTINPIYLKYASPCKDRYLMLFGGAGSGKSDYAANWKLIVDWLLSPLPQRIIVVRKTANKLNFSVWAYAEAVLKNLGLWSYCDVNTTLKTITYKPTGNKILMIGLDDPEKIKSIFKPTKIWIEEASELDELDFVQLDLRLRGDCADYFQIVLSFNPVHKGHWLVKHTEPQLLDVMPSHVTDLQYLDEDRRVWRFAIEDEFGERLYTTVLNTNYKHNKFLDKAYLTKLNTLASIDERYFEVYKMGRWGSAGDGNNYAPSFSDGVHVTDVPFVQGHPIHYTTDFNVAPYMSGLCIQQIWNKDHWEVRVFREYALGYPFNEAFYLGDNFINDWEKNINFGVMLYGDASGNNRLGVKDTKSLFDDVLKGFGRWALAIDKRIPTHNPRYDKIAQGALGRRTFLNACFSGKIPVRMMIDRRCYNLIKDLSSCKQDANGRLAKPKNKDGIEERGHHLQALEYYICHPKSLGDLAII